MLNALKRRIARHMSRRVLVQNFVKERLRDDLLGAPELQDATVQVLLRDRGKMAMLLKNPQFFDEVLRRHAANPEALYRLLQRRPYRDSLDAQGDFLTQIAGDSGMTQAIMERVPPAQRPEALQALLRQDAGLLDAIAPDGPMSLAAMLAQARFAAASGDSGADRGALRALANFIGTHRDDFIAALTRDDGRMARALMNNSDARDQILLLIGADRQLLSELMSLAALQPGNGDRVADRLRRLLAILADLPAFRAALNRDPRLRQDLADLLQDGVDGLGQPGEDARTPA